ncbi:hypothetical protein [Brevundimonas naejangsanensis]|uniref:hypothetical protein n=1 Tax=Brevundimonas naejangsanensis TaxID=588932 RepID=UPI0034D50D26
MSTPVIKAITKRIRLRLGSTENAAIAAGVSKSVWSDYENADKPETSLPFHRLLAVADTDERKAFAALLMDGETAFTMDVVVEALEATEAVVALQGLVRRSAKDGEICEREKRAIRDKALEARAQVDDVLTAVSA